MEPRHLKESACSSDCGMYLSRLLMFCPSVWTHCLDTLRYYDRSVKLPELSVWFCVVGPIFSAGTVTVAECLNMSHESIAPTIHHLYRNINMWHQPENSHIMIVMSRPISATASPTSGKDAEDLQIRPHDHQIQSHLTFTCELTESMQCTAHSPKKS